MKLIKKPAIYLSASLFLLLPGIASMVIYGLDVNLFADNLLFAAGVSSLLVFSYFAYIFRNAPKPYPGYVFGAGLLFSVIYDLVLVLGIFSLLNKAFNFSADNFLAVAVLSYLVLSFYKNMLVFDEIRKNLKDLPAFWEFSRKVDFSVGTSISRAFSSLVIFGIFLFSIMVLGGMSFNHSIIVLMIGMLSSTLSSLVVAPSFLLIWKKSK